MHDLNQPGANNEALGDSDLLDSLPEDATREREIGVTVKGWRNGLLLILPPDDPWESVLQQVHLRLDEAKARSFWRGAQTTIDCGYRDVSREELAALTDFIRRAFGLVPVAAVAAQEETRKAAEKLALTAYLELPVIKKPSREKDAEKEKEPERSPYYPNNALYVPNTMRSGQRLVHDGHVVICGDVNAGAEVLAGGDIVVMGALRGLAHAGYFGDASARIVAGSLRPPQLRIASEIARAPEDKGKPAVTQRIPEVARIIQGVIDVSPL